VLLRTAGAPGGKAPQSKSVLKSEREAFGRNLSGARGGIPEKKGFFKLLSRVAFAEGVALKVNRLFKNSPNSIPLLN
jgi:hypothetical protein